MNHFFKIALFLMTVQTVHSAPVEIPGKENWGQAKRVYSLTAKSKLTIHGPVQVTGNCKTTDGKAEAVYSDCIHTVKFADRKKELILKGGDIVFLSNVPGVIGTLSFGCCGSPDTARFYTDDGRLLGQFRSDRESQKDNVSEGGVRDFENYATPSGFFLVAEILPSGGAHGNNGKYVIWAPGFKKKEPVEVNALIPPPCGTWGDLVHFHQMDDHFDFTYGLSECEKKGDLECTPCAGEVSA